MTDLPVDDWDPTVTDAAGELKQVYPHLAAWVEDWLSPTMRRRVTNSMKWCERWWAHPEAAARLTALWAAWEVANAEGGSSMSTWWIYHFDSHWPQLTDPHGPFEACRPRQTDDGEATCSTSVGRLPVAECPAELLPPT